MDKFVQRRPKHGAAGSESAQTTGAGPGPAAKRARYRHDFKPESTSDDHDDGDDGDRGANEFGLGDPPGESWPTPLESASAALHAENKTDETAAAAGAAAAAWVPGQSSIYVDAFELALDTVLEEEAHLFDEPEAEVFRQWRLLGYEARYLYVRLFLRKTAAWHRIAKLGYHADIADPDAAIRLLQKSRVLPPTLPRSDQGHIRAAAPEHSGLDDGSGTFTFADDSAAHLTELEEAAALLSLDELSSLAKQAKIPAKRNKAELVRLLSRVSRQQAGLLSLGIRPAATAAATTSNPPRDADAVPCRGSNQVPHFLARVLAILGPCIRLSPAVLALFQRVHLVFYRSAAWTETSLTTIILSKMAKSNYADYVVCRTANIFATRADLIEFEAAIRAESEVDDLLASGGGGAPAGEESFRKVVTVLEHVHPRWTSLVAEEVAKEAAVGYRDGEGAYLRRFTAAHSYTRILHKVAYALGRLRDYEREHGLLAELLAQPLFHPGRRGSWYQRKALLEERYMHALDGPPAPDPDRKKALLLRWRKAATATCEAGLQDNDCHLIYHHDLQKRLVRLERLLRIPRRLQHDFGHVRLRHPVQHTADGVQIKRAGAGAGAGTRTVWLDESQDGEECGVEAMCLSWYRRRGCGGGWKGFHSEGGVVRALFAYLFFDIMFLPVPNVFQTAYQTCPLDLHTDAFAASRAAEINARLADISNGGAEALLRRVHEREAGRRTAVVGLSWEFELEDLVELARSLGGAALAALCRILAQDYRHRGAGMPDLVLWRGGGRAGEAGGTGETGEAMFVEVKSKGDRLSDRQRMWIDVLSGAGVTVALCSAVAREVREG